MFTQNYHQNDTLRKDEPNFGVKDNNNEQTKSDKSVPY